MWWKRKEKDARPVIVAEETFHPGEANTIDGAAPASRFSATFEDDGKTGYFYGLDMSLREMPILDALHIYDV